MNLDNILKNITYKKVINRQNFEINKVCIDTRKIKPNDLFVGIKGKKYDGNKLFKEALIKGASICILESIIETDELKTYLQENKKTIIIVEDTIKTLGELAKYKRDLFIGKVIAITGSSGKTSTKDIIYNILKEKYNVYKTNENLNNEIGLPLSILEANLNCDYWILEIGMNHLNEISYLSKITQPNIAVITNIGSSHIGNLGNRKNILKAKLEILDGLKENGLVLINNDNDLLHKWYLKNKKYIVKTIGIENKSDYQATNIKLKEQYSEFIVDKNKLKINTGGIHFIYNALIGYAIGKINNVNVKEIKEGINKLCLSKNRMNIIKKSKITIIDDCYNSNYNSCSYSLKYLGLFKNRKIAVLGTMKELGKHSKKYHKLLGKSIKEAGIDILITVGEYTNLINKEAEKLGLKKENSYHYKNNSDAINKIKEIVKKNDVILIKASHSMNFKEIVEKISM